MEQINYNSMILSNYQKMYPNLVSFSYDSSSDSLVYEGNYVKLNGYGLSRIDPVFFNLMPEDIFIFMKNGFYQSIDTSRQINELVNQFVITEEEITFIKRFVLQYIDKLNMYARNRDVFDKYIGNENIKAFMESIRNAKSIIDKAKNVGKKNSQVVYEMILDTYNKEMEMLNQSTVGNEKTMSLTRVNNKFSGYGAFEENEQYLRKLNDANKMNVAGYTSIVLIVSSALAFGMYLAVSLFLK